MANATVNKTFIAAVALIFCAVCLSYFNALSIGFITDDYSQIVTNETLHSLKNAPALFTQGAWHEGDFTGAYYRPLAFLTWMLEYAIAGARPFIYHLDNVILHFLCSLMAYLLAGRILRDGRAALFAAVLFAVHPVHTEAVDWAACRMELLFSLFVMASFWLFISRPRTPRYIAASCALFLAGLLSKETAIVLPGLLLCYILIYEKKAGLKAVAKDLLPYILTACLYLAVRTAVMGLDTGTSYLFTNYEGLGVYRKFLFICQSFYEYIRLSFLPFGLTNEYIFRPPSTVLSYKVILPLALLAWLVLSAVRSPRRHALAYFSAGWFLLWLFPVSNIIVPAGVAVTERALYLPSLGPIMLLGAMFSRADYSRFTKRAWYGTALLAAVSAAFIAITHYRNTYWSSYDIDSSIESVKKRVEVFPENPINHMLLAYAYLDEGKHEREAEGEIREALKLDPSDDRFHYMYARILKSQRRFGDALDEAMKAVSLAPSPEAKYFALAGGLLQIQRRYADAESMLDRAIALAPDNAAFYVDKGNLLIETGRDDQALSLFEKAVSIDPSFPDAYLGMGIVHDSEGDLDAAVMDIRKAVELKPDSADMRYFLASEYMRAGRRDLAGPQVREALRLDPSHAGARKLLGILNPGS